MTKKNVALKLPEDVYAQVGILAKLHGQAIPDEIRQAVTEHLDRQRAELTERSAEVMAAIDQEAEARRSAMQSLLGPTEVVTAPAKGRGGRRTGESAA